MYKGILENSIYINKQIKFSLDFTQYLTFSLNYEST